MLREQLIKIINEVAIYNPHSTINYVVCLIMNKLELDGNIAFHDFNKAIDILAEIDFEDIILVLDSLAEGI